MSLSRRSFFRTAGAASVGLISSDLVVARGREARVAAIESPAVGIAQQGAQARRAIKIGSNENAYGPGPAAVDAARSPCGCTSERCSCATVTTASARADPPAMYL